MDYHYPFTVENVGKCNIGNEKAEVFQIIDNKHNAVCDCYSLETAELVKDALNEYYFNDSLALF